MTGMQVAQVLESDSSSDSSFFANLPLRSATTEYHCSYRRFGRFARTPSENQAVMITPSFYFADHELLRNQRPKNDETVRSRLAQQKSPVVMFVAFMGTAPSCCFSHVPGFFGHTSHRRTSATLVLRAQHDQRNASIAT